MSSEERSQVNRDATNESDPSTQSRPSRGAESRSVVEGAGIRAGRRSAADVSLSRRALIQAGWTVPAILAVKLPRDAFAQYAHGDAAHADGGAYHVDTIQHVDTAHGDFGAGGYHLDTGHIDTTVHGDATG